MTSVVDCCMFITVRNNNTIGLDMNNALNIINSTYPKMIMTWDNGFKAIYGKRHVLVSYNKGTDLFDLHAFNIRGVNMTKEVKIEGVYIDQLKQQLNEVI